MSGSFIENIRKFLFSGQSPLQLYFACVAGVFIWVLPLSDIRLFILLMVALVFRLNIILMLLGILITILFPMVHLLSFWFGHQLSLFDISGFSSRYISSADLLQWIPSRVFHILGSILAGSIVSLIIFPIFYFLYKYNIKKGKAAFYAKNFIFSDSSGKRISFLQKGLLVAFPVLIVVALIFGITLNTNPLLPDIGLKKIERFSNIKPASEDESTKTPESDAITNSPFRLYDQNVSDLPVKKVRVFAFYVPWDLNSGVSLNQNIKNIDVVIPEWFHLQEDLTITSSRQTEVDSFIQKNNVMVMPLIHNLINGKWNARAVHNLIVSPENINRFIHDLLNLLKAGRYYGVNIDFENLDPKDKDAYRDFIKELSRQLHKEGYKVSINLSVDVGNVYDHIGKELVNYVDYLIMMLYDEHYSTNNPGPVASQKWFRQQLDGLSDIPKEKLVVALGNYGYDWNLTKNTPAQSLTFADIMDMAREGSLKVKWDADKLNPYFMYQDGDSRHSIWFLDGATLYNELKYSVSKGIPNAAIWVLGSEDPSIWNFINKGNDAGYGVESLKVLKSPGYVRYVGEGEVLRVVSTSRDGTRSINVRDGFIINENYDTYPELYKVARYGKSKEKKVVLTFDDGPDKQYTPQILDILNKYNIKAAFFVIGENALANPDLIKRINSEGHEIGNHTFFHSDLDHFSDLRFKLELNFTQRLVQYLTGHSTLLFRPPSGVDVYNPSPSEFHPIQKAQEFGYTVAANIIDSKDWKAHSADDIYQRVMEDLPGGDIILLHDAGGNRDNTVKALPGIIEALKSKGYEFSTISSLIGKTRDGIMPSVQTSDNLYAFHNKSALDIASALSKSVSAIFYITTCICIFRFIFLIFYSLKQHKKCKIQKTDSTFKPLVSVVIPAYNEEKVIRKTINSILESSYENMEIIVVNDGSIDRTSEVIKSAFADNPKIILLEKINGGKSSALNLGFKEAAGEIVVVIDADTVVSNDAISILINSFKEENVAAVSGNVKVGNVHNLLTKWQHIEYVMGFNLERRAFAELNCIPVVPGAIGAWRRDIVAKCGYYKEDTLAEDADMTLTLLKNGYKVKYAERAHAYTESPANVKSLLKQRSRWAYGILQCLWKHKDMLFNNNRKSLGFLVLPNMWLFQYVFQPLSPIADMVFILGLVSNDPSRVTIYYIAFLLADYIAAIYAFRLEKENIKVLVWLFLQRIIYRLLMTYVIVKSIFSALKGIQMGWSKVKRIGDVRIPVNFAEH